METSCWTKDREKKAGDSLHIASNVRKGLRIKVLLLSGSGALICLFIWALWAGSYTTFDTNAVMYIALTLGLGLVIFSATLYGGFVRQTLTADKKGVTYMHWPLRKRIPWSDLEKVEFLGVNHPSVLSYAVVFNSKKGRINIASDFEREDLQRLLVFLQRWMLTFNFVIEDKE